MCTPSRPLVLAFSALVLSACADPFGPIKWPTLEPFPTAEPVPVSTIAEPMAALVLAPVWDRPDVPPDVLQPFPGTPRQWWFWVPIHPAARLGGEASGGFHFLVDISPSDMFAYYKDALRQAGWEERMDPLLSGDYSLLSYDRYGAHATIYLSPYGSSTLVSIVVD